MTEDNDQPNLGPMSEFDPSKPAMVHDRLNNEIFAGNLQPTHR